MEVLFFFVRKKTTKRHGAAPALLLVHEFLVSGTQHLIAESNNGIA